MAIGRWSLLFSALLAAGLTGCDLGDSPNASSADLSIARVSGNGQENPIGTLLPNPLVVLVTDAQGRSVANRRVDFAVTSGRAILSLEAVVTDAEGFASVKVRLGDQAGSVTIQATVFPGPAAVVFTVQATEPATPADIGSGAAGAVTDAFLRTTHAGNLVFEFLAGNGLGEVEFGLGTPGTATSLSERDVVFTAQLDYSGSTVQPAAVVNKGHYPAGSPLEFYGRSVFRGSTYWAFTRHLASDPSPSDLVMFRDTDFSLGRGGSVVDTVGTDHWILHLDDAASICCDDDDNELVIRVRVE